MISANVELGPLLKKLRQIPREATRIIEKAVTTDARGFVRDIVMVTPPFYRPENPPENNNGEKVKPPTAAKLGKEAKIRGELAVMRDIRKVYITPGKLYDMIKAKEPKAAAGFWQLVKAKQFDKANRIARRWAFPELLDFGTDDGALHQSKRRFGRVTITKPAAAVENPKYLNAYIKSQQSRVGLLAAGFKSAADRLQVKIPPWIARHSPAVGNIRIDRKTGQFAITISNNARHGRKNDLPRRIAWVLKTDKRKKRLINSIRYDIRAVMKRQAMNVA